MSGLRNGARGVLALGIGASIGANVLHSDGTSVGIGIAAWPPVALLLTVELIAKVPATRKVVAAVRLLVTVSIAGIAAWVSYWHMVSVVARYGEHGSSAHLWPFLADGMILVASVTLVDLGGRESATVAESPKVAEPSGPSLVSELATRRADAVESAARVAYPGPTMPATQSTAERIAESPKALRLVESLPDSAPTVTDERIAELIRDAVMDDPRVGHLTLRRIVHGRTGCGVDCASFDAKGPAACRAGARVGQSKVLAIRDQINSPERVKVEA